MFLSRLKNYFFPHEKLKDESVKPFHSIPGPSRLTLIARGLPGGKYYNKTLYEITHLMFEEYGEIFKVDAMMGNPTVVFTSNPENFEKVFRAAGVRPDRYGMESLKHYRNVTRAEIYSEYEGLLSANDEKWAKMRSLSNSIVMQPRIVKVYVPQTNEIAQEFIEMMKDFRDENSEMPGDFYDHVIKWTHESIFEIIFERRLNLLNGKSVEAKVYDELVHKVLNQCATIESQPPLWRYFETSSFKEFIKNLDDLAENVKNFINEAKVRFENDDKNDENEEGILRKFLKLNKDTAFSAVHDLLIAGISNTSATIIFILYCLAKNPGKQEKLREEVMEVLPSKDTPLTPENMEKLSYLRACMKEAMRKIPTFNGMSRRIVKDIELSGYFVPANTVVACDTQCQHKNLEIFYDPDAFLPERWMRTDNEENQCPHATSQIFTYIPFGVGTRMCVGKRFAEMRIEILVSKIIRNFEIEWHHEDMKIKDSFSNYPASKMRFKMVDVDF